MKNLNTNYYTKGLIVSFILIISFRFGKSIKCYKCSSLIDVLCNDPLYGKFPKIECVEDNFCLKLVIPAEEIAVHKKPELMYMRNCMPGNYCSEVKTKQPNAHHCSICKTDFCNSYPTVRPSSEVLLYLMVLLYMVKLIF